MFGFKRRETAKPSPSATAEQPARPPVVSLRGIKKIYRMGDHEVSALDGVNIDIAIELNDRSTFIRVSNPLSDAIDLDLLVAKAEHLSTLSLERSSELSKLRIEGGSGVAKLHKIVRHEIGDDLGDYEIRFCVDEHRHFVASVRFNIGVQV